MQCSTDSKLKLVKAFLKYLVMQCRSTDLYTKAMTTLGVLYQYKNTAVPYWQGILHMEAVIMAKLSYVAV